VLLIGLSACTSPTTVYRLDAQAADSSAFWQQGRRVVTQTIDSLQVAIAYARTGDEGHNFRLAFVNRSATPVAIDPTSIYAVVTQKVTEDRHVHVVEREGKSPTTELRRDTLTAADTLRARNPENVLLELDKAQARAGADARSDARAQAFFLMLDAVSEIASGPQSPEERTATAAEDTESQLRYAEEQAKNRRTQARLGQHRARWAQSALRRTTLMPGMRTTGFVVVPVVPLTHRLEVHVDIGSAVMTVPFQQSRYDP
jgi:hypothetical protein